MLKRIIWTSHHEGFKLFHLCFLSGLRLCSCWLTDRVWGNRGDVSRSGCIKIRFEFCCYLVCQHLIEFIKHFILAFLCNACKEFLSLLDLLLLFSHLILKIGNAVYIHILVHICDSCVSCSQRIDYIDVGRIGVRLVEGQQHRNFW